MRQSSTSAVSKIVENVVAKVDDHVCFFTKTYVDFMYF